MSRQAGAKRRAGFDAARGWCGEEILRVSGAVSSGTRSTCAVAAATLMSADDMECSRTLKTLSQDPWGLITLTYNN
jgi:hypothetical protein